MASRQGTASVPTGCYKCGRPGHWSRDCTANPGGASAAGGAASAGSSSTTGGFSGGNSWKGKVGEGRADWKTKQPGSQLNKSVPKETIKKEPKKRPKLTPDLLLSEGGLGYVLERMPEMVTIKGREDTVVRDLKSLLEGYMHWHSLLLPYFSFEQFVEKVEKLGNSKRVRMCTRELRDKIVYGKEPTVDKEVEAEPEAVAGSTANETLPKETSGGPETEIDHNLGPDEFFTDDDDEPVLPVNDDEFEDFFRQGIVEPEDTRPSSTFRDTNAPGLIPDASSRPSSTVQDGNAPELTPDTPSTVRDGNAPGIALDASAAKLPSSASEGVRPTEAVPSSLSSVTKFTSLASEGNSGPRTAAPSTISESAAARMEANRLQALERARARRASNFQL